jgi:hypothetical protein
VLIEVHCGQYDAAAAHAVRASSRVQRHDSEDGQTTVPGFGSWHQGDR